MNLLHVVLDGVWGYCCCVCVYVGGVMVVIMKDGLLQKACGWLLLCERMKCVRGVLCLLS